MTTRRMIVSILALALLASASPVSAQLFPRLRAKSSPAPSVTEKSVEIKPIERPTAELAQKWLEEGNARFRAEQRSIPNSGLLRVKETAQKGQHPFATVLSCSDSRVPLEVLFDRGVGDIFVIRVAGNTVGDSEIGSIEYGVEHVGTPLLVILGHTKCGAVTAAATHAHTAGHITGLVGRIQPAVEKIKNADPAIKDDELVRKAAVENVWASMEKLMMFSEIIRDCVKEKKVRVVGAMYDLETGAVEWLGEHTGMKKMIEEN